MTMFLANPSRVRAQTCLGNDGGKPKQVGKLCLIPANISGCAQVVGGRVVSGRARAVRCYFDQDRFTEVTGLGQEWNPQTLEQCLDIRDVFMCEIMGNLAQESISPGFASDLYVESLGNSLLVGLARYFRKSVKPIVQPGSMAPWMEKRIVEYLETHCERRITASELGAECGISGDHLRRIFKQTTGQTLWDFVAQHRLKKAKKMLIETDIPVGSISTQLGFSHPSNFSVSFINSTGQKPTAFRQMHRANRR